MTRITSLLLIACVALVACNAGSPAPGPVTGGAPTSGPPLPTAPPGTFPSPGGRFYVASTADTYTHVIDPGAGRDASFQIAGTFWRWTAGGRFAIFRYAHPHGNTLTYVFDTAVWEFILETEGCKFTGTADLLAWESCGEYPAALSPSAPHFLMENGTLVDLPGLERRDLLADWRGSMRPGEISVAGAGGGFGDPFVAAWSPDGAYLAFVVQTGFHDRHVLILASGNGDAPRQIGEVARFPQSIEWAADGRTATVHTGTGGAASGPEYVLDAVTGTVQARPGALR